MKYEFSKYGVDVSIVKTDRGQTQLTVKKDDEFVSILVGGKVSAGTGLPFCARSKAKSGTGYVSVDGLLKPVEEKCCKCSKEE